MAFTPGFGGVAKLEQYGMRFDELNRIRVLDEDTANQVSFNNTTSLICVNMLSST
jgi:hypothetical protein